MRQKSPYLEEVERLIIRDADSGMTAEEIAEKWDKTVNSVKKIARGHFYRKPRKSLTVKKKKEKPDPMKFLRQDYVEKRLMRDE